MAISRSGKKILKVIGISAGSLLLLLTAFHFWVVYHAEEILQDLVASRSKGKLKLEVRDFKFNWFSKKMQLHDAVFYSTDTVNAATTYRFAVKKINIKLTSFWPLVFDKEVLINNLELKDPEITVTRLRKLKDKTKEDEVSVPKEMGRLYNSIQDALQVLQVRRFELDNASFQLINKIQPDQQPVAISHIDLTIQDLKVDTSKFTGKEKFLFSENIILRSRDQDILFPDKRHRLSFRKFRVNIEKKIVEFDSCTLAVVKTDNTSTGFSIFFDALVMTNINFDTLYRSEVIKADSVYCINPVFKLTADLDNRKKGNKASPKLDEIIRKMTGDMMLNFVIVNNASFDINTIRNGNPSSFKSQNNNFEMQGLRIDDDAVRPLKVEKFAMAIRNYENFLRDSLYALQFDSIQVNNDKIFLNNFSFQKLNKGKPVSNFSVPRFMLTGLSWDDLLFERRLKAQQATLYDPVIDYNELPKKTDGKVKRNIFGILSDINNVLMLEDMNIINGDIHVHLNGGIDMRLKKANMSVESRALLGSDQLSGIRRSISYLDFNKGVLQINDLNVQLDNINYTGADSRLKAEAATVTNTSGSINARAKGIVMKEVFINEFTGDVSIGGLNWQQADIDITNAMAGAKEKKTGASFISLTDIMGKNTKVHSLSADKKISAFVDHISATAFLLKPGEKPFIAGLDLSGKELFITGTGDQLHSESFSITDQQKALFGKFSYKNKNTTDTTSVTAEKISFVPDVQMAINGEVRAADMKISDPVINIHTGLKAAGEGSASFSFPKGSLDKLVIERPILNLSKQTEKGISKISWDGRNTDLPPLVISNILSDGNALSATHLNLLLNTFLYEAAMGKKHDFKNAVIKAELNDLSFKRSENKTADWQATISKAEGNNFIFDSLGKKNGKLTIDSWELKDALVGSSLLKNIQQLSLQNKKTAFSRINANYTDANNRFDWSNAAYSKVTRSFTLDSFSFTPLLSKEEFAKAHPYQTDYIRAKTGRLAFDGFDLDAYLDDKIVRVKKLAINDIVFDDYRDMQLPFEAGIIKHLTTKRIKNIPFKLSIDTVMLNDASVTYAETSAQTKQTGVIPITRMNVLLYPVRNFNLSVTDSLRMQASGYLLDSVGIRLRLVESYTDTLSTFLLTASIDPADLRIINPILVPLTSAKIRSGVLDSFVMRINGDDYYAYGEMDMHYHDLKIRILRSADPKGRKFRIALINFIANSFLIKNKNSKRTGIVFFVRNRDRSSLNYLVKMLTSGAASSVGVKSTRKKLKPFKKEMRKRKLPSMSL